VSLRSQGIHGSGGRAYSKGKATLVLHILRNECVGPDCRITVDDLSGRVGLLGRAVRDIVRDLELAQLVLTNFSDGYYVCTTREQAERATRRLDSQVQNMCARIEARRAMTDRLP
jgi:DNA-binding GntR family transcriptional regulator